MLAQKVAPPDFPDDPRKWDGWSKYRAENPYERLCFDPASRPNDDQIQHRCTTLLQWWKNKLPLKNQPSNPMAQLLGRGLDEAAEFLVQARVELLDPERRQAWDEKLAADAGRETLDEFIKFASFSIKGGTLSAEAEMNLMEFGQRNGLAEDQIRTCIEAELQRTGARRTPAARPLEDGAPATPPTAAPTEDSEREYVRLLRLGALNMESASYTVRAMLAHVADNLGIAPDRGEQLLDGFLEEQELLLAKTPPRPKAMLPKPPASAQSTAPIVETAVAPLPDPTKPFKSRFPTQFVNPIGARMLLLPPGQFVMGSDAPDAQPNEQPLTPVALDEFYISLHPITNAQYEQFDLRHKQKRMEGAGADHPVVYVTSIEAMKFCEWLGQQDGRKYRLPTEAEWEFAARGTDGRKYPWGNNNGGVPLANFADASTNFPWRDPQINDGYAETSPVGAFPQGASFFGLEDMAGNVWEWCLDFVIPLSGSPKHNPRGPASGAKRTYRGGSWKSRFTNLRATARASNAPNYSCNDLGFRIVCECDPGGSA